MLILTRRPGERICIGEDVVITIMAVKGNQVRIGIAAPRQIAIDREEIHQRKIADRQEAITLGNDSSTAGIQALGRVR